MNGMGISSWLILAGIPLLLLVAGLIVFLAVRGSKK
jgi:hypothetical protein